MKKNEVTGNKNELAAIDELEINPLTDEELNAVAGGFLDRNTTAASCSCCAATATNHANG